MCALDPKWLDSVITSLCVLVDVHVALQSEKSIAYLMDAHFYISFGFLQFAFCCEENASLSLL